MNNSKAVLSLMASVAIAGASHAGVVNKSGLITLSETWSSDNVYNLVDQVYVMPGATLTIEAGTVIQSTATNDGSGSLAITKAARIVAQGTADNPIIFTSSNDDFTTWREAANEWGNLTVMGAAFISNSFVDGNSSSPSSMNVSPMEGLIADGPDDNKVLYGGGNDDDNSGTIEYVSLRYGGRVVGLTNELNGLSLGGIGRATDISHVEIMNNVDDGIEIWGGTVNVKYASIWNVGDDSFDIDQGWRGKAQFVLIVQGYSVNADQGSGLGDNCFETDGAEDSDAQPVTTAAIYNATVIGQPLAGDGGTAWRDGARVQYRSCIFMDLGEELVRFDGDDGDGASGYGFNGTLPFIDPNGPDVWDEDWNDYSPVNAPANPSIIYQAQTDGKLAEIRDSVFFRNLGQDAYANDANNDGIQDGSDGVGVTINGGSNPAQNNVVAAFDFNNPDDNLPVAALVRQFDDVDNDGNPGITVDGKVVFRVLQIDPRAANDAVNAALSAPDDGFFTPVSYRGAFATDENWLCNWTAADAYGFVIAPPGGCPEIVTCSSDIDGSNDGVVNVNDLLALLSAWGTDGAGADIAEPTNIVDVSDLLGLLAAWGNCP